MKTCVIYFSHNKENYFGGTIKDLEVGNTKVVAKKIVDLLACDESEIVPVKDYPAAYARCTDVAKAESLADERPAIKDEKKDLSAYDTIILGYPNWWGTMPMVVKTFLEKNDLSGKTIYPYCTHEGSGMGHSEKDLSVLCPQSHVKKGLPIRGGSVEQSDEAIKQWLKEVM